MPTQRDPAAAAEQGLPENTVESIAQTPDGYLWVGTQEGLARFDGVRFVSFSRRTEPGRALGHLGELADRRSLVILMSDLLDAPADLADRLRQLRSRGHDVTLFHLLDPDEVELPFEDLTDFEGLEPEDPRKLLVDPRDLASSFRRESLALRERWRMACLEARVEYRFATTTEPPADVLRAFLFDRQRARRR